MKFHSHFFLNLIDKIALNLGHYLTSINRGAFKKAPLFLITKNSTDLFTILFL